MEALLCTRQTFWKASTTILSGVYILRSKADSQTSTNYPPNQNFTITIFRPTPFLQSYFVYRKLPEGSDLEMQVKKGRTEAERLPRFPGTDYLIIVDPHPLQLHEFPYLSHSVPYVGPVPGAWKYLVYKYLVNQIPMLGDSCSCQVMEWLISLTHVIKICRINGGNNINV